ncbi:TRAP transporter small permease [Lutimaribacter sp. EGI FJ00015]|uniref:TRAP transporter small permease n=1 Tax=Lutimaribacter degradans TaxID=2945989 RepID=A0ACC5ZX94_9RHOB|nr:TRAP transporter small permease [Lutimaribacter sp. EGI FJ00013]MCM2562961.1 TRAP transporter small permease [Lutimaribacter sp. EGI FJ00013]MCO0614129.1 TRAP transporter small permease [Lutimaribacter sp. EGI FJ00015]MCO0636106.1 TRAP transporter small permease [Lutimaribacter sp. EGI FJ00014]
MLTRSLNAIYWAAGVMAGVFLVAICVIVSAQIVARQLGTIIPSADQFAGFCLAATSFLGLAYSFRHGSHIRVTLFVRGLRGLAGRLFLAIALATAAAMTLLLAWHTIGMVLQNFSRGEVTSGLVPVPLWFPQLGMAVGVTLFGIAIVEDLVRTLAGHDPSFIEAENRNQAQVTETDDRGKPL